MTLKEKAAAAREEYYSRTLCSTGNHIDGWNHGGTNYHNEGIYELSIFAIRQGGEIVKGPANGKRWKYRNNKLSESDTLELIRRKCDQIGLRVGSLKVYKNGPL